MSNSLTAISRSRVTGPLSVLIAMAITFLISLFPVRYLSSTQPANEVWLHILNFNLTWPVLSKWINFAVMMFCGWGLYKINDLFGLSRFRTNLQLLFYILFYIGNPSLFFTSEGTFAALFILGSLFFLFSTYQQSIVSQYGFLIGISLGTMALFWTKGLLYIPIFIIGLSFMRALNFRSFLAVLLGVIAIFWLQFAVNYFMDSTDQFFAQFKDLFRFTIPDFTRLPRVIQGNILLTFVLGLISGINLLINNFKEKVRTQVCYNFVILLSTVASLLTFFDSRHMIGHLTLMYFTIAFLASSVFTSATSRGTTILFYLLLILYSASFAWITFGL